MRIIGVGDIMSIYNQYYRNQENIGRLLVKCPDKPGIVAALSKFLFDHGADIMESSQYSSEDSSRMFYIRFEYYYDNLLEKKSKMEADFEELADNFKMDFTFTYRKNKKRSAIFVSKETHCLLELLWEWQSGDLDTDIPLVISNHEDAREIVEALGIPFYYIPANKEIREQVEAEQMKLLEQYKVDVLILARYMQILTPNFVKEFPNRIINIH